MPQDMVANDRLRARLQDQTVDISMHEHRGARTTMTHLRLREIEEEARAQSQASRAADELRLMGGDDAKLESEMAELEASLASFDSDLDALLTRK